jgi:hypothetical protein
LKPWIAVSGEDKVGDVTGAGKEVARVSGSRVVGDKQVAGVRHK